MINFTRNWVDRRLDGLWEEMCGIYRTFPARYTAENGRVTRPAQTAVDLTYARNFIPFSDLNAARLLHLVLEDRITYVGSEQGGAWHFYNEVYHAEVAEGIPVGDMVVEAFAQQIKLAMDQVSSEIESLAQSRATSTAATGPGSVAALRKALRNDFREHFEYQRRLFSDGGLNALKSRFRKQCQKGSDHFDNDRRWLVCQNGVIDLDGFRKNPVVRENFRDLSPHFAVKRAVECKFNPDAKAPNWEHFLETSIPDEEVRAFLQRLVGAAFLAESKVKAIPNLQGPKDCGKTIFVNTLERLAGGYGVQPAPDALMIKPGQQNWEQDTLRGARFVGISEPSPSAKLDDTFCKQVTGGDEVRTRTLRAKSSPWTPQCVIFIASNHPVNFTTSDNAFVERLCLIQFPHQFFEPNELPEGDWHVKDNQLEQKLAEESEGIFLWVIRGMWEYLVHGIGKPESVKTAGQRFVTESSGPLSWLNDKVHEGLIEIVSDPHSRPMTDYVTLNNLYAEYAQDCISNFDKPMGKHGFSRMLEARYGKQRSGAIRFPGVAGLGRYERLKYNDGVAAEKPAMDF